MYNNINMQLVSELCPDGMNKQNCPARKYVLSRPDLYTLSQNETVVGLAKGYNKNTCIEYANDFLTIVEKCNECRKGR